MYSPDGQVSGIGGGAPRESIGTAAFGPGIAIPTTSRRAIRQRQGGKPDNEPYGRHRRLPP